ncbi:MAG: hypothetical protein AAB728_02880 [Patescibacteria group bacterium]
MHAALLLALSLSLRQPSTDAGTARPNPRSVRAASMLQRLEQVERKRFTYTAALQQPYRNNQYGFSLRYPGGWKMQHVMQQGAGNLKTIIMFISPLETDEDEAQENINLIVEKMPSPLFTLDEYTEAAIRNERGILSPYTLHASHGLLLGGTPAHRVSFTGSLDGKTTVAFEQIWMVREGHAYVWSLAASPSSLDKYAGIFRQMVASAEFRS